MNSNHVTLRIGILLISLVTMVVLLPGCTTNPAIKEARDYIDAGRNEDALNLLDKASRANPDNIAYRAEYFRQRELAITNWLAQAETLRMSGQFDAAASIYKRIQIYDPKNVRAQTGLTDIDAEKRHSAEIAKVRSLVNEGRFGEARDTLRSILNENPEQRDAKRLQREVDDKTLKPVIVTPQIKTTSSKPISLELHDVTLRSVFDVIAMSTGLSFVFDRDIRADTRTSIAVRNATPEELILLVLSSNQLAQKLVSESTILVYPNLPQKQREYQELVIRAFYLTNAEAKQTANMIRTLVKTRDIFVDEKLNMLVIKDTPSAIRMAEKLVAAQDLADPEVMLEVEVLEVGSNRLLDLGIRYPDSVAWSLVGGGSTTTTTTGSTGGTSTTTTTSGGTPGVLSLVEWLNRSSSLVRLAVTNPLFLLHLRQQDGSTSVLANPRIRVKNKEKARIHIGDRVPVITTTAAAVGGFVSESVSYLDVGLKLEVEPLIHLGDEVSMRVGLEVSNIVREIVSSNSNTRTYQVGTRNASTVLRLKDGETQILAGLISDEDRRTASRVPGLGSLPVLGRLFSDTHETRGKTEIVLLITPHLLRTLDRPDNRVIQFSAGTEASTGAASTGAASAGPSTILAPPMRTTPVPPIPNSALTPPATGAILQPGSQPAPPASIRETPPAALQMVPFGGLQPAPKPDPRSP